LPFKVLRNYPRLPVLFKAKVSVVDTYWFQCGSGFSKVGHCGSISGFRVLMTKKCTVLQLKKSKFFIKNSKLQKKPSALRREHPALQNMKFLLVLFLVVIFAFLDPDLADETSADPCGC
jgi:hypothetical protein